jgi:hypothetical protein
MSASRFILVRGAIATLTLGLAAALSGCQAQNTAAASARSTLKATAKKTASAAATTAKPTPKAPAPKITAPPTTPCATTDLSVAPAARHVTIGVQVERFTVTTTDPTGCTLTGPLNLSPKGPLSAQVPGATVDLAVSQQGWPGDLDVQPPSDVTIPLLPGKSVSFYFAWFAASPIVCVQSNGFGFNAPGDTTYSDLHDISYPIGPICDGVFYVSSVF